MKGGLEHSRATRLLRDGLRALPGSVDGVTAPAPSRLCPWVCLRMVLVHDAMALVHIFYVTYSLLVDCR